MVNNCKVDFMNKEIRVSKGFYKAAQIVGTKEFETLIDLQQKAPTFRIVFQEHSEPIHKTWYPTYSQMFEYLHTVCHGDPTLRDALAETISIARITGKGYNMVRRWFMDHCYNASDHGTNNCTEFECA